MVCIENVPFHNENELDDTWLATFANALSTHQKHLSDAATAIAAVFMQIVNVYNCVNVKYE